MELQLKEFIDQIKREGVEQAEKEASLILANAKEEAEVILANAKTEAERILSLAKAENERTVRVGEEALRQAGRNVLLSFRESVTRELGAVIEENTNKAFSSQAAPDCIARVVLAWSQRPEIDDIALLLNEEDLKAFEGALLAALKERMLAGVTLKTSDAFDGGFRISVNGGRAYYDYSADAVTEMMSAYLNPKVTALLKEAKDT